MLANKYTYQYVKKTHCGIIIMLAMIIIILIHLLLLRLPLLLIIMPTFSYNSMCPSFVMVMRVKTGRSED